jgi:hypothetical protein
MGKHTKKIISGDWNQEGFLSKQLNSNSSQDFYIKFKQI